MSNKIIILLIISVVFNVKHSSGEDTTASAAGSSPPPDTSLPPPTTAKAGDLSTTAKAGALATTAKGASGGVSGVTGLTGVTMPPIKYDINPDISFVFANLFKNETPEVAYNASKDFKLLFEKLKPLLSDPITLTTLLENRCDIIMKLYNYFVGEFNKTGNVLITSDVLLAFVPCKRDCNFEIITNSSLAPNSASFLKLVKDILGKLPKDISTSPPCKEKLGKYLTPVIAEGGKPTADAIKTSIGGTGVPITSVLTSDQLGKMDPAQVLALAKDSTVKQDDKSKAIFGPKLPPDTNLTDVVRLVSDKMNPAIINNTSPKELALLTKSMDVESLSPRFRGMIVAQALEEPTTDVISNLCSAGLGNSIDYKLILKADYKTIPRATWPETLKMYDAAETLKKSVISDLTGDAIANAIPGLTKSDMKKIPTNKKKSTAISINSASSSSPLSSVQQAGVRDSLIEGCKDEKSSTDPKVYLTALSTADAQKTYDLFIEASTDVLTAFSSLELFKTVLEYAAKLTDSDCCRFKRTSRYAFTKAALDYLKLTTDTSLTVDNLDSLGPCFASALPLSYLNKLDSTVFFNRINYFQGSKFQIDADTATVITALITKVVATITDKETFVFDTLKDLSVYYDGLSSLDKTKLKTYGSQLISDIVTSKNPSNTDVQPCRLGLNSAADINVNTKLTAVGTSIVNAYRSSSSRKRRATTSFTCTQLESMGNAVSQITTAEIEAITKSEFESCIISLGKISWTSAQLTSLADKAKLTYTDLSAVTSDQLSNLNYILLGFSATDLAKFKIDSLASVSAFGSVSGWTAAQLTALAARIKSQMVTLSFDVLNAMASINCGLADADINAIANADFSKLTTLSSIAVDVCPNLSTWFAKSKSANGDTTFTASGISQMGAIFGGISTSDVASITADVMSSIDTAALNLMPASVVNTFSTAQWNGLSSDQASALANSPAASGFSAAALANLNSLSSNLEATMASSTIKIQANLLSLILASLVGILIFSNLN